jgi:hypothetical protein
MSGWLYGIDERELRRAVDTIKQAVQSRDDAAWRSFWQSHKATGGACGAVDAILQRAVPEPDSGELVVAMRVAARAVASRTAELWEKAWHVHYPDLSDEEAGFEVSESEEYEAVGRHVFAVGAPPQGLEFLNEHPDVATNWVSFTAVGRLWQLEQEERMLATVGAALSARGTPLGHDLLVVRGMLEFCASSGAGLYLWDPGT